jgi:hypothetical protein
MSVAVVPGSSALNLMPWLGFGVLHGEHGRRGFGRRVERQRQIEFGPLGIGHGPKRSSGAGDGDNIGVFRLPQQRKRGLRDTDNADGIRVEGVKGGGSVQLRRQNSGIVDQDVKAAFARLNRREGVPDRRIIGDVKLYKARTDGLGRHLAPLGSRAPM